MAKVLYGGTTMDARGKVGGGVYSKNKSGAYIKRKVSPTQPNTTAQTVVRTNFTNLSKAWGSTLAESDRTQWNNFAALWPRTDVFGQSVKISGQNMFISLGQRANQILIPVLTDPPTDLGVTSIPVDPTSLVMNHTGNVGTFKQLAVAATNSQFYVFATAPLPPGRAPKKSDYRYIGQPPLQTTGFPADVPWQNLYGAVFTPLIGLAGKKISIAVGTIDVVTLGVDAAVIMTGIVA